MCVSYQRWGAFGLVNTFSIVEKLRVSASVALLVQPCVDPLLVREPWVRIWLLSDVAPNAVLVPIAISVRNMVAVAFLFREQLELARFALHLFATFAVYVPGIIVTLNAFFATHVIRANFAVADLWFASLTFTAEVSNL